MIFRQRILIEHILTRILFWKADFWVTLFTETGFAHYDIAFRLR